MYVKRAYVSKTLIGEKFSDPFMSSSSYCVEIFFMALSTDLLNFWDGFDQNRVAYIITKV